MAVSADTSLVEELPVLHRLALSYAPSSVREPTLALLALDTRLAAIVRSASEPMLAQLRLAWWREQLQTEPSARPRGEPLLAALRSWESRRGALVGLVDGWEAMTGEAPLSAAALASLAEARGAAFAALAELAGATEDREVAARLGCNWAFADLVTRLSDPDEQRTVRALAEARDWRASRLLRKLRPLVVLHGLAARQIRQGSGQGGLSPPALLLAMRLGLLGR